jgi:hypothetical protein
MWFEKRHFNHLSEDFDLRLQTADGGECDGIMGGRPYYVFGTGEGYCCCAGHTEDDWNASQLR